MADIRIKDLAVTAGSSASDDYLAVDGSTNGTRKLSAYSPTFGGNLTVSGTGTSSFSGSLSIAGQASTVNNSTLVVDFNTSGDYGRLLAKNSGGAYTTAIQVVNPLTLQSNLNVTGIGTFNKSLDSITTETDYAIRIKTSAEDGGLYLGANSTISAIQAIDPGTTFARNLAIQSQGGNVLIGTTTNDTGRLQVNGTATVVSSGADQRTFLAKNSAGSAEFGVFGSGKGYLGTTTNDDFEFYSNNALALTLTTTGNLRAGSAADANNARIYSYYPYSASGGNAAIGTEVDQTGALRAVQFANPNGIVGTITTSGSATSFNTSSDLRLKTNIAPSGSASALIDSIQIVEHDWKAGGHVRFGVIAQDIQAVAPEAVFVGDEGEEVKSPWGVDYSKLVPALIKEVQTLRARVAALETA